MGGVSESSESWVSPEWYSRYVTDGFSAFSAIEKGRPKRTGGRGILNEEPKLWKPL